MKPAHKGPIQLPQVIIRIYIPIFPARSCKKKMSYVCSEYSIFLETISTWAGQTLTTTPPRASVDPPANAPTMAEARRDSKLVASMPQMLLTNRRSDAVTITKRTPRYLAVGTQKKFYHRTFISHSSHVVLSLGVIPLVQSSIPARSKALMFVKQFYRTR